MPWNSNQSLYKIWKAEKQENAQNSCTKGYNGYTYTKARAIDIIHKMPNQAIVNLIMVEWVVYRTPMAVDCGSHLHLL